jgi:ribosomal protein L9
MAHRIAELMNLAEHSSDETAREDARQKCAETITKVWEARGGWLRGNPLTNLAEHLRTFKQFYSEYGVRATAFSDPDTEDGFEEQVYQEEETEQDEIAEEEQDNTEINPLFKLFVARKIGFSAFGKQPPANWLEVFLRVVRLNLREEQILHDLALAELPLENIQDWIENVADFLSVEERQIIGILQEQKAELNSSNFRLDDTTVPNFATIPSEQRNELAQDVLQKVSKEREQLIMDYLQSRLESSELDTELNNNRTEDGIV